jgi:replication-associated recombination protein RarA
MSHQLITKKGYCFFEVSSAFQKSVRRGLEEEALYWAIELYSSNFKEYAWKRLKIMVSEDIGIANPSLPAQVSALYDFYISIVKGDKDQGNDYLFFIQAVVMCVRSPKSRLIDDYCCLLMYYKDEHYGHLEIPDYALDKHTRRGKALGRGIKHFYEEASKLHNHTKVEHEDTLNGLVVNYALKPKLVL